MKKILLFSLVCFACIKMQARYTALCDVVYEISEGEWSEFRRAKVEFAYGREIDESLLNQNKLYALIWFSQYQCAKIDLDYSSAMVQDMDKFNLFLFLGMDILNEGKLGEQVNDNGQKRKWRIYGKDENNFFIDPALNEFGDYKENNQRNINNGQIVKRQRPKEELKYAGLIKATVQYVSPDEWYIVKTKDFYVGVKRNTIYYFYGSVNVGDTVFADFHQKGRTSISNATQNYTNLSVIVVYMSNSYEECFNWMRNNNK